MFIKRLNRTHFDVFVGNGWNNWSRVRLNHWGVSLVDGVKLARDTLRTLNERLVK